MSSAHSRRPSRLLFASCNSQHYEQPLWPVIASRNATAFIWSGDAIYADDFEPAASNNPLHKLFSKMVVREATPAVLTQLYQEQLEHPGYRQVVQQNMTWLGALDDHDYGCNNGDRNYRYKLESGKLYLDFLQASSSPETDLSVMMQRAKNGHGVYGVKVFDFSRPEGHELLSDAEAGIDPDVVDKALASAVTLSNRSVAVFCLDVRTNKSPWRQEWPEKYFLDYEADFLGRRQWQWFEEALRRSTASVNVVVQGLQVHADRFFDGNQVEDWSRFPRAQHRLYQALLQKNVQAPVLVSGDVHMAEYLRKDCRQMHPDGSISAARSLLEVTTSGMTHSWGTRICARPNSSMSCRSPYINKCLTAGMHLAHVNHAWTDLVDVGKTRQEGAKPRYQYSLARNFGEFEFDFDRRQLIVRILGEEENAPPLLSVRWDFDALSGKIPMDPTGQNTRLSDYETTFHRLSVHGAEPHDWICVNYGGRPSFLLKMYGVLSPVLFAGFLMSLPLIVPLALAYVLMKPRRKKQGKK